jgi:hypothetical protein
MVPICVSEPIGFDVPLRMASTPAMNVVATAPIPGVRIPSFPLAGRISMGFPAGFVGDMSGSFLPGTLEGFQTSRDGTVEESSPVSTR